MKFIVVIFAALLGINGWAESLQVIVNGKESNFELSHLQKSLKPVTVTIQDPNYKTQKSFDGFLLQDILKLAGMSTEATADEIVFTAKDGYSPNASFAQLKAHKAIVAFQEHATKLGFAKLAQGKAMVSPAPFYLVWDEGQKIENDVPWPYQLIKIELVDFKTKYSKLFPDGLAAQADALGGFKIFKNECLRCHSINLQGGEIGPELNIPKNITEYWDEKTLRAFIADASSFRAKDKMPSFSKLSPADIDHLLAYLTFMRGRKL